ncbi:MAG TPA: GFA family protein [Caulobacteraceae bacterium]|jgi:hypothetical protein|nr:GFA family protein [Caulobacteraceae bacterium]
MTRIARCCCGACQIEAAGEPVLNAICHCDNCKQRTGSAFGWSAYFPDTDVQVRGGAMGRYELPHMAAERFFCAACGTTLYWRSTAFMPGHTGVAGGCFTTTPLGPPVATATDAKRCTWITLPDGWFATP